MYSDVLLSSPLPRQLFTRPRFHDAIEACFEAATSCWISADAFISEPDLSHLRPGIDATLRAAEVCAGTARKLLVHDELCPMLLIEHLRDCIAACEACAAMAQHHQDTLEHCQICAHCCQRCVRLCERYIRELEG
jgi:hypothetical protein